jgi:hypothetical protein
MKHCSLRLVKGTCSNKQKENKLKDDWYFKKISRMYVMGI